MEKKLIKTFETDPDRAKDYYWNCMSKSERKKFMDYISSNVDQDKRIEMKKYIISKR